jgi:hypothetical protein
LRVVLRRVVLLVLLALLALLVLPALPAQHVRQVLAPVVRQALVQALAPVPQLLALNHFCR